MKIFTGLFAKIHTKSQQVRNLITAIQNLRTSLYQLRSRLKLLTQTQAALKGDLHRFNFIIKPDLQHLHEIHENSKNIHNNK